MPDQNAIDLSSGLVPKQPAQDSGIDLSAGLTPKVAPRQANPASESQMFDATTGGATHIYNPSTKQIEPLTPQNNTIGSIIQGVRDSAPVAIAKDIIVPPSNAREHAIAAIAGPGAIVAYRQAKRLVDSAETTLKSAGDKYPQAVQDFQRTMHEFKNGDYRNAASSAVSTGTDVAAIADPALTPLASQTRELSEGARPGGNLATPLTRQIIDAGTAVAAEPAAEAVGDVAEGAVQAVKKAGGKTVDAVKGAVGKVASPITDSEIIDRFKTRAETPKAQHGEPVRAENTPLDSATINKQLAGKDLSQEATDTLHENLGTKTIEKGGTAKNSFMRAVKPTTEKINTLASKMNDAVKDAHPLTTSAAQDAAFGGSQLTDDFAAMKKNLPPSVRESLSGDIDAVMEDANDALNSHDASEVLETRRKLGNLVDWSDISKNPTTAAEVTNAARARIYRALGEKIHDAVPETVDLDRQLSPQLELRSHMRAKLGSRLVDDPLAASAEAESEFRKGKVQIDTAKHNLRADKYRRNLGIALGLGGTGITLEGIKKLFGL